MYINLLCKILSRKERLIKLLNRVSGYTVEQSCRIEVKKSELLSVIKKGDLI